MVLAFVAPLEALAGVFAFLARDSGAATGLSMLGAAWAATALTVLRSPPGGTSVSLGIFLLTLAAMMLVLSAGALRSKPLFGSLLDADIVTLQETILTDRVDQAADMLGPGYHLVQQRDHEDDGRGITTASKWPFGRAFEIDFHLTERTRDFACTCLVIEILALEPVGRIWVANHFPDYQHDHERERRLQNRPGT